MGLVPPTTSRQSQEETCLLAGRLPVPCLRPLPRGKAALAAPPAPRGLHKSVSAPPPRGPCPQPWVPSKVAFRCLSFAFSSSSALCLTSTHFSSLCLAHHRAPEATPKRRARPDALAQKAPRASGDGSRVVGPAVPAAGGWLLLGAHQHFTQVPEVCTGAFGHFYVNGAHFQPIKRLKKLAMIHILESSWQLCL